MHENIIMQSGAQVNGFNSDVKNTTKNCDEKLVITGPSENYNQK